MTMELDPPSTNLLKRPVSPAQPESNGAIIHHDEHVHEQTKKAKLDTTSTAQIDKAVDSVTDFSGKENTHRKGRAPVKRESVPLSNVFSPITKTNAV